MGNMAPALLLYSQEVGRGHRGLEMLLSSCERDTLTVDLPEKREREVDLHKLRFSPKALSVNCVQCLQPKSNDATNTEGKLKQLCISQISIGT